MNTGKIIIVLADGFEETEAVATADVLKRLGFHVSLAGLDSERVRSSAGTTILADLLFRDADLNQADALVLPGGLPGALHLRDSSAVSDALRFMAAHGKVVAAICAAPIALERAGLAKGKKITGYPGTNKDLAGLNYTGSRVERDGLTVTAKGPGVSFEFAAAIAQTLGTPQDRIDAVLNGMFVLR